MKKTQFFVIINNWKHTSHSL